MANYYVLLSTHIEKERDTFYAKKQLRDRRLSIGWGDINPINKSQPEIKRIIEDFYPDFKGTVNPDIGAKSLTLFANLIPSDIVFVRGVAKILDVVIVNGTAYFDRAGHYDDEYYLKVPFVPLFGDKQIRIKTADIPDEIYNEVVYEGGRSMVIRQIEEATARELLKAILAAN
jgi:hypothetical protein